MRILFIGGMYRGLRLAQRLLERGEEVVGAYVYDEDAHESPKYAGEIASLFAARVACVRRTRRITAAQIAEIQALAPDVLLCLGWRTLIPMEALNSAPLGGIAVHDSLLPKLRGFAPTNWGMILGHDDLGATLFQLTDSVDAGNVYFQQSIKPGPDEPFQVIQDRIAEVSVQLFDRFLDASRAGTLTSHAQNHAHATYTCARSPSDGEIDWRASSAHIDRMIRALGPPAPGAFTYHEAKPLIVVEARDVGTPLSYEGRIPGRIVDRDSVAGTVDVLCGAGVLRIRRVIAADGTEMSAASVMRSVRESLGLNLSQEVVTLRERLDRLESMLNERQWPIAARTAG